MQSEQWYEMMSRYLDGRLSETQRREFEAQLARDAGLRGEFELMRSLDEQAGRSLPGAQAEPSLWPSVRDAIESKQHAGGRIEPVPARHTFTTAVLALSALAAVALVAVLWMLGQETGTQHAGPYPVTPITYLSAEEDFKNRVAARGIFGEYCLLEDRASNKQHPFRVGDKIFEHEIKELLEDRIIFDYKGERVVLKLSGEIVRGEETTDDGGKTDGAGRDGSATDGGGKEITPVVDGPFTAEQMRVTVIFGKVVDSDGKPVAGRVDLVQDGRKVASDETGNGRGAPDGKFEFKPGSRLASGANCSLHIVAKHYLPFVKDDLPLIQIGKENDLGTIVLDTKGVLTGVVMSHDGKKAGLAGVFMRKAEATLNPGADDSKPAKDGEKDADENAPKWERVATSDEKDGSFKVAGIEAGRYEVYASHPDFEPSAPVIVEFKDNAVMLELRLNPPKYPGMLTGYLKIEGKPSAADELIVLQLKDPASNPEFTTRYTKTSPRAGDAGNYFYFKNLPDGVYKVVAAGRPATLREVTIANGTVAGRPPRLLDNGKHLSGKVTADGVDFSTVTPQPIVLLLDKDGKTIDSFKRSQPIQANVNKEGIYKFDATIPAGEWFLQLIIGDVKYAKTPITVPADQTEVVIDILCLK